MTVVFSFQFSSSAKAQIALTSPGFTSTHSIDGIDCITADDADEEPLVVSNNSPDLPNDFDLTEGADKADIPSRSNQGAPDTTSTTLDTTALRRPGIIPAFLFPNHSSYFLHEHIRERAPPSLA